LIVRHLEGRDFIFILICVALVVIQVFLDLTIPQYMERITTALQMGTSTEVIASYGRTMVLYAFLSLLSAVCAGACAAKAASSLGKTLRRKQFDNNKFSANSQWLPHMSLRTSDRVYYGGNPLPFTAVRIRRRLPVNGRTHRRAAAE